LIRRILLIMSIAAFLPVAAYAQERPSLVEMLALYPGQEAVYTNISDSTGVSFQNGVYLYNRYFKSEAMVLRRGGGGISSAAGPIVTAGDDIDISAYTISPDGDTIVIPDEEIAVLDLYGKKRRYAVSFPDARAGAIFVFQWRLRSMEPVFSGRRYLGRTYPVVFNRTVISAPTSWVFKFLVQPPCLCRHDRSREYIKDEELWMNYIWEAQTLPGLVFEEDSPPASQLIPCLYYAFSYDKRWPDIQKNRIDWPLITDSYKDHLNEMGRTRDEIKDEVKFLIKDISDKRERLRKVVDFVTSNFKSEYSDIDISASAWDLLTRGYGSQAEAAMLVGSFLNLSDIPFGYVLISTRDNGEVIESLPALFYFNRLLVTARIDADTIWIDPFYRGAPIGVLPFEDQAVKGLRIGDEFKGFITTPESDYRENGYSVRLRIEFGNKGQFIAEGIELLSGALNIEEKYILQNLTEQERYERWVEKTTEGIPGAAMEDLEFDDIYSDINPFKVSYRLIAPNYIDPDDERLYIPLDILGRWRFNVNYDNRKLPIELGQPFSQQERIIIEMPPGYRVEHLPENFTLNSYLGEILSVVTVSANTITVIRGLGIKPYKLQASEAESLTGFFNTASDQAGKFIILRR
jgi:hypothetical protein